MRTVLISLLLAGILLGAAPALAADFLPLVTCGGPGQPPCTPCELFATFKRTIDFVLVGLTGPVAAFMVVVAGGMMLLAGGKPALFAQGQRLLTNTLMGVAVILLAWVATNFLIKSLGKGSGDDAWYSFTCPAFLQVIGEPGGELAAPLAGPGLPRPAIVEAYQKVCSDESALAANYGLTPAVKQQNAPELDQLISCLTQDPVVKIAYNRNKLYTYERDNPLCNLTRGFPVCGVCAHSHYSCHYGGHTGATGAQAADFQWNGVPFMFNVKTRAKVSDDPEKQKTECYETGPSGNREYICRKVGSQAQLYAELACAAKRNACGVGFINYEGDHIHISTLACDADGKNGISKIQMPPDCAGGSSTGL